MKNISIFETPAVDSLNCFRLRLIGFYCVLLFVSSFLLNSILLLTFYFHKKLRTPYNIFIIALTAVNLIATVTTLPFVIVSNFYCGWIFGQIGCTLSAFMMFWTACTSIYILTALSYARYQAVKNHMIGLSSSGIRKSIIKIAFCALLALVWAILPIFGWSRYEFEGMGTSCSVSWNSNSMDVISYNLSIFASVFVVPLVIMGVLNLRIFCIIKSFFNNQRAYVNMISLKNKILAERGLIIITITLVACFTATWSPYAVVSFYKLLIDAKGVDPFYGTLPAMFAKSSLIWNSLFFIMINKQMRDKCIRIPLRFRRQSKANLGVRGKVLQNNKTKTTKKKAGSNISKEPILSGKK